MSKSGMSAFFGRMGVGKDRDVLIECLGVLAASGAGVSGALDAASRDVRTGYMRRIIEQMKIDLSAGVSLWRVIADTKLFPDHVVSLIRVGEESGKLAENLRMIGMQLEKDRVFRAKVQAAMVYPLFVLGLAAIIGLAIAWFMLPKLAVVFAQLKLELPLITRALQQVGLFLQEWGVVAVPTLVCVGALCIYILFFASRTRAIGQTILFSLPGVRQLIREIELARCGFLLGTLLRAGIPITSAVASLSRATQVPPYRKLYEHLERSLDDGNGFAHSFESYRGAVRLFPASVQQMVIIGEQSGSLAEMLLRIGEIYEQKTEVTTKNLTVILEPALLVVVWVGVVGVALAVILPIYNLIGGLGAGR